MFKLKTAWVFEGNTPLHLDQPKKPREINSCLNYKIKIFLFLYQFNIRYDLHVQAQESIRKER